MIKRTTSEIEEFFNKLYDKPESIKVNREEGKIIITVAQMYQFVPVDFEHLSKIGEFFDTDKVNGSRGAYYEGCETCDYGSSYEADFVIEE